MTAKKKWLNKIYHESQDFPKNTQVDISWSSSESDEETHIKKQKVDSANNKWITSNLKQNNITIGKIESKIIHQSSSNCYQSVPMNVSDLHNWSPKLIHIPDYSCNKTRENNIDTYLYQCYESPRKSPVIGSVKIEELSPVLVQTTKYFNQTKEASPILGNKRHILKKIRSRYKTVPIIKQINESSPDLFETQSTQVIESESPEQGNDFSLSENFMPTKRIDPFPSQHSSQIINSNSDSSATKDNIPLYHQPAPKKKQYKKGGLASLLQKTLHIQRTRVSIWQHEMYTKKTDSIINFEEGEIIDFVIKSKWKEYGCTLLECSLINFKPRRNSELSTNIKNVNVFIIVIGFSTNLNITFNINEKYKMFPPYSIKCMNYKSEKVSCYFNVSKLTLSKVDL